MVGRNLPGLEHGTAEMAYYPEYQESYLGVEIVRPHLRKSVRGIPHPVRKHPRRKKWGLAVRYNPEVLYHLAPEDKVEDILREGLKPSNETKMTTSFPEMTERTHGRVFLVPKMSDIERVSQYLPRTESVILRVDTHGIPLYEGQNVNTAPRPLYGSSFIDPKHVEYYSTRRIPPERVSVVGKHAPYENYPAKLACKGKVRMPITSPATAKDG